MKILIFVLLAILGLMLLLLLILLCTKARVFIEYSKKKEHKFMLSVRFSLFGGLVKREVISIPSDKFKIDTSDTDSVGNAKKQDEELKFFDKVRKYYQFYLGYKEIYQQNSAKIRKTILAERVELDLKFGTGDAAETGIMTGAAWAGIYNVVAFAARIIRITEPQIAVTPLYNELCCELEGKCIISGRLANLIGMLASIGISYLKMKKRINKEKAAINNVNTD